MTTTATRTVYCRMTDQHGDRCTGEALSATADVYICMRHAALVLDLVNARMGALRARAGHSPAQPAGAKR